MKTLAAAMVVAAGLCVGTALGQNEGSKGSPAGSVPAAEQTNVKASPAGNRQPAVQETVKGAPAAKGPTVSIKFPGGTIAEYYSLLRKIAKPLPVNVVAAKEILETRIPEIWLEDVSMDTAVFAVQAAAADGTRWRAIKEFGELYQLQTFEKAQPQKAAPRTETVAYPLDGVIKPSPGDPADAKITLSVETVLSTIEQLVAVSKTDAGSEPPKIVFHRESGLLMLSGDQEIVRSIVDMIRTLERDVKLRREEFRSPYAGLAQTGTITYVSKGEKTPGSLQALLNLAAWYPGGSFKVTELPGGAGEKNWSVSGAPFLVAMADMLIAARDPEVASTSHWSSLPPAERDAKPANNPKK